MTPLRGQNVYSADGTRYLGCVGWTATRKRVGWWVVMDGARVITVIEWDRALGGWLAI